MIRINLQKNIKSLSDESSSDSFLLEEVEKFQKKIVNEKITVDKNEDEKYKYKKDYRVKELIGLDANMQRYYDSPPDVRNKVREFLFSKQPASLFSQVNNNAQRLDLFSRCIQWAQDGGSEEKKHEMIKEVVLKHLETYVSNKHHKIYSWRDQKNVVMNKLMSVFTGEGKSLSECIDAAKDILKPYKEKRLSKMSTLIDTAESLSQDQSSPRNVYGTR